MAWHLASAARGIFGSSDRLQEHLGRGYAKSETQGTITVVWNEPVIGRLHCERSGDEHRFVTSPRNLKEDPVLRLQLQLFIVYPARHVHQAIDLEHGLTIEAVMFFDLRLTGH